MRDIWRYSAENWGEERADAYVRAIDAAILSISRVGFAVAKCDTIRPGYVRVKAGSHFVFAKRRKSDVVVVRVLHERMNFDDHLG